MLDVSLNLLLFLHASGNLTVQHDKDTDVGVLVSYGRAERSDLPDTCFARLHFGDDFADVAFHLARLPNLRGQHAVDPAIANLLRRFQSETCDCPVCKVVILFSSRDNLIASCRFVGYPSIS